jgi:hypothetical protein
MKRKNELQRDSVRKEALDALPLAPLLTERFRSVFEAEKGQQQQKKNHLKQEIHAVKSPLVTRAKRAEVHEHPLQHTSYSAHPFTVSFNGSFFLKRVVDPACTTQSRNHVSRRRSIKKGEQATLTTAASDTKLKVISLASLLPKKKKKPEPFLGRSLIYQNTHQWDFADPPFLLALYFVKDDQESSQKYAGAGLRYLAA